MQRWYTRDFEAASQERTIVSARAVKLGISLRTIYAIVVALVLATALPHTSVLRNGIINRPDAIYAPNLAGLSPGLPGNGSTPNYSISIGNVTAHPITGVARLAIILAEFSDIPHAKNPTDIEQEYFGQNNSVAAYYLQVSYGKFTVKGDVFGWFKLPYPEAHYGRDCTAIDDADCSGGDQSWQIAQDAATLARNNVTFANYDYYVFVHSGNGEETSGVKDDVWSVTYLGGVYANPCLDVQQNCNQKTLTRFNITPELEAGGAVPLGVYCHEFGHQLGLPDMYDTTTGKSRMGSWELMDKGLWNGKPPGSEPAEFSAWSRSRLGWLPQTNVVTISMEASELATIVPLEEPPTNGSVSAVVVEIGGGGLYLFENREPIGNDAYLPDHGLVGYDIDANDNLFTTLESPAASSAFHPGDLVSKGQVTAKVVSQLSDNSVLVGFGAESSAKLQSPSSLTISVVPNLVIPIVINNETYTTDPSTGEVSVTAQYPNETFQVTLPQTLNIQPGVRIEFGAWDDGDTNSSRFIFVNSNMTVSAAYRKQYLISVLSQYGTPTGSGWYDENSQDTVSVDSVIDGQVGTRYVFAGWAGDVSEPTNPFEFQVTRPMNLTALWTTFEWMQLSFYDSNSTQIFPSVVDSLTLRAPNGTMLTISNLQLDRSFWFEKGTYQVVTAYVYGVDTVPAKEDFATSPNGNAMIQLELYTAVVNVRDSILGSSLTGGSVTITLPNGQSESSPIISGRAMFDQLPVGAYSFKISRDWSLDASGFLSVPNQSSTTVSLIVIPSLAEVALVALFSATLVGVLIKKLRSKKTHVPQGKRVQDNGYSDYWNR